MDEGDEAGRMFITWDRKSRTNDLCWEAGGNHLRISYTEVEASILRYTNVSVAATRGFGI